MSDWSCKCIDNYATAANYNNSEIQHTARRACTTMHHINIVYRRNRTTVSLEAQSSNVF